MSSPNSLVQQCMKVISEILKAKCSGSGKISQNEVNNLLKKLGSCKMLTMEHLQCMDQLYPIHLWLDFHKSDLVTNISLNRLSGIRSLVSLDFMGCRNFDNVGLAMLDGLPHLASLDLSKSRVDEEGINQLKSNFTHWKYLLKLYVLALPSLRSLGLCDLKVTDAGLLHVVTAFPRLERLKLSRTRITDRGIRHMVHVNTVAETVSPVDGVSARGVLPISVVVTPKLKELRFLELIGCHVTDRSIQHFAHFPNLLELNVQASDCTPNGMAKLQGAIRTADSTASTKISSSFQLYVTRADMSPSALELMPNDNHLWDTQTIQSFVEELVFRPRNREEIIIENKTKIRKMHSDPCVFGNWSIDDKENIENQASYRNPHSSLRTCLPTRKTMLSNTPKKVAVKDLHVFDFAVCDKENIKQERTGNATRQVCRVWEQKTRPVEKKARTLMENESRPLCNARPLEKEKRPFDETPLKDKEKRPRLFFLPKRDQTLRERVEQLQRELKVLEQLSTPKQNSGMAADVDAAIDDEMLDGVLDIPIHKTEHGKSRRRKISQREYNLIFTPTQFLAECQSIARTKRARMNTLDKYKDTPVLNVNVL